MKRIRKSESGQVMVLAASAMLVIIGMAALAVDIGFLYATRRNMQTAADAAAIAGSNALKNKCGTTSGCTCDSESVCAAAGTDVATLNGYTTTTGGSSPVTVTVKTPASAPSPTNGVYVEADITQPVPTYFLRALGYNTMTVSTTAIAGYDTAPNCVYVGDPSGSKTLTVSGGATLSANCGILDESTDSDGMDDSGGSTIAGTSIGLVASGYSGGGSPTCGGSTASCPTTGVAPSTDPLSYLDAIKPTPGGCVTGTDNTTATSGAGGTINPGTYCNGIKVTGGATLNLNPGVYVVTGSNDFTVSASKINSVGTGGVTIFRTGTGKITLSGGSTVANLTASTSGPYVGILFYQDKTDTAAATISGGATGNVQGALYFPAASMLTFSGGSSANTENVVLDAWKITVSGGNTFIGTAAAGSGQTPPITTSRLYQ